MNKLNFFFSEYFASYKKLVNQIEHKKLTLFLDLIKKKKEKKQSSYFWKWSWCINSKSCSFRFNELIKS